MDTVQFADLLDRYLDNVQDLPPAPTVAIELLDLFSDPDRDIHRIVKLIADDPSLTAETLHRCNHGIVKGSEPAQAMFEAVSRLGLHKICSIIVGVMASRTMRRVRAKYIAHAGLTRNLTRNHISQAA